MTEQAEMWGRQYPDGTITWQIAEGWTPAWATPEGRQREREDYARQLAMLGVENGPELVFVHRIRTIEYSDLSVIDDNPAPEFPEPEPEPEVPVEPPVDEPVEGEGPIVDEPLPDEPAESDQNA